MLELEKERIGTCERNATYITSALRSVGLAATIDQTTWAHRNSGHFWNVLITDTNFLLITNNFMHPYTKVAKVWRYQYGHAGSELFTLKKKSDIPLNLLDPNTKDVTNKYVSTLNIKREVNNKLNGEILYLTYFNSNEWVSAEWAKVVEGSVIFKNVGHRDIVYQVSKYKSGRFDHLGDVFIAKSDSSIQGIKLDTVNTKKFRLKQTNVYWTDIPIESFVEKGKDIELFYWDKQWISLGRSRSTKNFIDFKAVPKNALFLVNYTDKTQSNAHQRIFTLDDKNVPTFY